MIYTASISMGLDYVLCFSSKKYPRNSLHKELLPPLCSLTCPPYVTYTSKSWYAADNSHPLMLKQC